MSRRLTPRLLSLIALASTIPSAALAAPVSFSTRTSPGPNVGPPSYLHADLNNDGREDLVYDNSAPHNQTNGFDVQLSNGDGTYGPPTSYRIPDYGNAFLPGLTIGDFNSSGREDVVAFSSDGNAYLYRNNGSGVFVIGGAFPYANSPQQNTVTAIAGDFNHDSRQDLIYIVNGQLHVWFGNGNGGFNPGPTTPIGSLAAGTLLVGDFDGDGSADVAVQATATSASVLYGDGTGHFLKTTTVTAANPSSFYDADVNSDGKMDLLATQYSPSAAKKVLVSYGDAGRTLSSRASIPTKFCANRVSAADMDGNGINDLIVQEFDCSSSSNPFPVNYVGVLTRNTNGTYNPEQTVYTSQTFNGQVLGIPTNPLVLRADRNSKPDLLIQQCTDDHCYGYNNVVLLNTTSGSNFPSCPPPNSFLGINVCSPSIGTSVASPVPFAVGAAGPVIMRKVEVWADGKKLAEQLDGFSNYTFLNRSFSFTPGNHAITIFAAGWDNSLEKRSFTLSVK